MMTRLSAVVTLAVVGGLCTACPNSQRLAALGEQYKKANQAATDLLNINISQVKQVRRISAVVYYLSDQRPNAADNFDPNKPVESFVNFVCTGDDDLNFSRAGLAYTAAYASSIEAITQESTDSVGGYWSALTALRAGSENGPLALPEIPTDQFQKCREEVLKDLPPKGISAVSARPEAFAPAAVIAAVAALETLLKDGLKILVEAGQAKRLKVFIDNNRENYKKVLREDLKTDELTRHYQRRRASSITAPYYAFVDMLSLSRTTQRTQILAAAASIDHQLIDYDQIRVGPRPQALANLYSTINSKLEDFAAGKTSLSDAIAFLSGLYSELSQVKEDYDAAATKVGAIYKSQ